MPVPLPAPEDALRTRRDAAFRTRVVQFMLLGALVLRPIPPAAVERVAAAAAHTVIGRRS
jgi:hypothetical protein